MIKTFGKLDSRKISVGTKINEISSAVKELVENSLDANANAITVKVQKIKETVCLSVKDNGEGIEESDFEILCQKSSTSKIRVFEDLGRLSTLGFRGEALNCLCFVSDLTIITSKGQKVHKLKYDRYGEMIDKEVELDKKIIKKIDESSKITGTEVKLENFLCCFPVRRNQLLKNFNREVRKIVKLLKCFSLSQNISIKLINENDAQKKIMFSNDKRDNKEENFRIITKIGDEKIFRINKTEICKNVFLEGFIKLPNYNTDKSKSNSENQFIFLNRRWVHCLKIKKIIKTVYRTYYFNQNPSFVIYISMDSKLFDINISSDKSRVLFRQEKELLVNIEKNLRKKFLSSQKSSLDLLIRRRTNEEIRKNLCETETENKAPPLFLTPQKQKPLSGRNSDTVSSFTTPTNPKETPFLFEKYRFNGGNSSSRSVKRIKINHSGKLSKGGQNPEEKRKKDIIEIKMEKDFSSKENLKDPLRLKILDFRKMKVIGQFNLGFIVVELKGHLYVIDQHAADEKCIFERLKYGNSVTSQPLMIPKKLDISEEAKTILKENEADFNARQVYFEFSGNDALVTSVPTAKNLKFDILDVSDMCQVIKDGYMDEEFDFKSVREANASKACRSAIMIGKTLSTKQMEVVVRNLGEIMHPWNCPHGRPTICHLKSLEEVQRKRSDDSDTKFKRISILQLD